MPTQIPAFTISGLLPPWVGNSPADAAGRAPYKTSVVDLCARFSTTPSRVAILQGYLAHRAALLALGFTIGHQWCDGSFAEEKAVPSDIDIVTFFRRPAGAQTRDDLNALIQQHLGVFQPDLTKQRYRCDAYFVDLDLESETVSARTHYWYGLFSHNKASGVWKGLVQVPLASQADDATALAALAAWTAPQQVAP